MSSLDMECVHPCKSPFIRYVSSVGCISGNDIALLCISHRWRRVLFTLFTQLLAPALWLQCKEIQLPDHQSSSQINMERRHNSEVTNSEVSITGRWGGGKGYKRTRVRAGKLRGERDFFFLKRLRECERLELCLNVIVMV